MSVWTCQTIYFLFVCHGVQKCESHGPCAWAFVFFFVLIVIFDECPAFKITLFWAIALLETNNNIPPIKIAF